MLSIVATELRKTILAETTAMNPIRVRVTEAGDAVSSSRPRAEFKQFAIATLVMLGVRPQVIRRRTVRTLPALSSAVRRT